MVNILRHRYIILGITSIAIIVGGSVAAIRYLPDHSYTSSNAPVVNTNDTPTPRVPITTPHTIVQTPIITPNVSTPSTKVAPVINPTAPSTTILSAAQCANIKTQEQQATATTNGQIQTIQQEIQNEKNYVASLAPANQIGGQRQVQSEEDSQYLQLDTLSSQINTIENPYISQLAAGGCS